MENFLLQNKTAAMQSELLGKYQTGFLATLFSNSTKCISNKGTQIPIHRVKYGAAERIE